MAASTRSGAGLSLPSTRQIVNGFRVDFYCPGLGLVVEVDGLRYHRTAAQQASDRRRDQVHAKAGITALRFTHAQVMFEPADVEETLREVARHSGGGIAGLAAQGADQLARVRGEAVEQLSQPGKPRPQLGVADFDRQQ
jgi:hypothetical protein